MGQPGDELEDAPNQVDSGANKEEPESLRNWTPLWLNDQGGAGWTPTIFPNEVALNHGDASVAPHLATGLRRCERES